MADDDLGTASGEAQPVVVLVRPQLGENIGAAARGMLNFGLDQLRLVAPRDGWPNPAAAVMASGADAVLDAARVVESTAAACADLTWVLATTARGRALTKRVLTPAVAMAEARARIVAGERVGILFGPERAGLETADVVRAGAVVSFPVNPGFGSLNLAQCVLLMAYEWMRSADATPGDALHLDAARRASGAEVDRLVAHLLERLDTAGFFFPEPKRPSMVTHLENLVRRMELSDADVRTLHGVVRALADGTRRGV